MVYGEKLFDDDDDDFDSNEDEYVDHDLEPTLMQGIFHNEASAASAKRVTSANPDSIKSRDLRNDAFMKRMSIESGGKEENDKGKKAGTESTLSLGMTQSNMKTTSTTKITNRLQSARPNEIRMNKARKPPMRPKQSAKVIITTTMGT